jgi:hypothetical protein
MNRSGSGLAAPQVVSHGSSVAVARSVTIGHRSAGEIHAATPSPT